MYTHENAIVKGKFGIGAVPDGYPLPNSAAQIVSSEFESLSLSVSASVAVVLVVGASSNTQPSIHASLVTFAATLAAPTILNLESALEVTVN